jgi:hypothetical protein
MVDSPASSRSERGRCRVIRCDDCGAENSASATFCTSCGHYLGWEEESPPTPPEPTKPAALTTPATPPRSPPSPLAAQPLEATAPARTPTSEQPSSLVPQLSTSEGGVREVVGAIDTSRQIASTRGRGDLDQHLGSIRERLLKQPVTVVVVGEFKRGKSTLINALLQSAVCPVDADVVTAVPTTVCYAAKPYVKTFVRSDDEQRLREREEPLEALQTLVTEAADPADPQRERSVEVGLPHRMLRSGLRLVDTPGVGGLDSAHGFLTLGTLRHAQGVLFVTDAAQELTGPELAFLRRALEHCPLTALVITKTDLYPQWRRIVELNRGHLLDAGLELPVIPVSSFLRLRAQHEPALNEESGFADLVTFLARDVVATCREAAAQVAAEEFEFAAVQLAQQSEAERVVIEAPEQRRQVVAKLDHAKQKAARLADPTATWQKLLRDGIQDLFSGVHFDLQSRLRTVRTEVEEVIQQGDPQATWTETEFWLRRQVAMASEANRDLLTQKAQQLAASVAEQFDLQADSTLNLRFELDPNLTSGVALAPKSSLKMPGGKLAPLMMAARTGAYLPWVVGSVAITHLPGLGVAIAGIAFALGAGIGGKIIRDERARQRTYRQQQAKANVGRFIDEVAFLMNKQSDDALRSTERQLRDEFERRALLLHNSAAAALAAVERAHSLDQIQQHVRRRELAEQDQQLGRARAVARDRILQPAGVGNRG